MAENHMRRKLAAALFVMMLAVTAIVIIPIGEESSAAGKITVKDGRGNEVVFDEPASHVVTSGVGTSATVVQMGQLDKIVVCDSYSYSSTEEVLKDLKKAVDDKKIKANGNVYGGIGSFKTDVIDAADTETGGKFDKEKDVIILTAGASTNDSLKTYFEEKGFKKILLWDSITEYGKIIDFAKAVSLALTGKTCDEVKSMELVESTVKDKLADEKISGDKETKALYVRLSSGNYTIGNTGSLAISMLEAAGGNNIGYDSSKSGTTYSVEASAFTKFREDNGTDKIVVFLDSNVTEAKANEIKTLMGDNTTLVQLKSLWNNYSIDSKDGVWTMACALYPNLFEGDVPEYNGESNNTMLYIAIGGAAAVVILIIAFYLLKRH